MSKSYIAYHFLKHSIIAIFGIKRGSAYSVHSTSYEMQNVGPLGDLAMGAWKFEMKCEHHQNYLQPTQNTYRDIINWKLSFWLDQDPRDAFDVMAVLL